ncbi:MAG: PhzF family phenazine biosynthesis protein [Bryobacteraceae bacterium]|nr:PhzF family phenazine biosynthesis protein [Bryobacteraceae bacterium]
MKIPLFQVDAFSDRPLKGNPAAVCPLDSWLPDELMQSIAAENNLPETAFFVQRGDVFDLRWFTPTVEIDLCGHATLASAWVLFHRLAHPGSNIGFMTRSGMLSVTRHDNGLLALDFPSRPAGLCAIHTDLVTALGRVPSQILAARDYLVVYDSEEEIQSLKPDMTRLATVDRFAVIVTAPGASVDFVSRFFAPARGIPEDPVTGSAHCTLIPYWSQRLGKSHLHARQISPRGGELFCEDRGERVSIAGHAALYLEGTVHL